VAKLLFGRSPQVLVREKAFPENGGGHVPPFVPGRPDRILSGLAEILPGLLRSGLYGSLRPDRGVTEGCVCTDLCECFFEKHARSIYSTWAFP